MGEPKSRLEHRKALFMCAAHCQGGHSTAGAAAAEVLGVPFPIRMEDLEARAISEFLNVDELWPWLNRGRALRDAKAAEAADANRNATR